MLKEKQLVSQYLENISREALEKYQDIVRNYVRDRQGVYALFRRGKLYYVGLAHNLRSRLQTHLRDHHADSWDRFSVYLTIGDTHLKELESLVLRIIKPKGNRQKGKFFKAENLRSKFSSDIRRIQKLEWKSVIGKNIGLENEVTRVEARGGAVLAPYINSPMKLRAHFKGKTIVARVRQDGIIRFAGKKYSSPSLAAAAACERRSCNGWMFWKYERAPGDWVLLDNLRK
jgi:predicted GIY-YIG superfamily endonuclease